MRSDKEDGLSKDLLQGQGTGPPARPTETLLGSTAHCGETDGRPRKEAPAASLSPVFDQESSALPAHSGEVPGLGFFVAPEERRFRVSENPAKLENIEILKQALPYIKQYRDRTFVIKLGGELLVDKVGLDGLANDISLLYQLSIRVVIIHGGGPQLSDIARRLGVESEQIDGRRVTDDNMLELAKMVFAGGISTDILSALRRHGTPAVGLSGVDGDLIDARRRPPRRMFDEATGKERDVDFQNVGDILSVNPRILSVLLERRFVPVVASLGADREGKVLNINADTIAAEVAAALPAEKLFILSNVSGVLRDTDDPQSRYSYLTVEKGQQLIDSREIGGGMVPKMIAALQAVRRGVPRAHIINGLTPSALLWEVFTVKGLGTMVVDREEAAAYLELG